MAVKSLNNAVGKAYFQSAFIFGCLAHVLHRLTVIRTFWSHFLPFSKIPYALLIAVFPPKMIVSHSCSLYPLWMLGSPSSVMLRTNTWSCNWEVTGPFGKMTTEHQLLSLKEFIHSSPHHVLKYLKEKMVTKSRPNKLLPRTEVFQILRTFYSIWLERLGATALFCSSSYVVPVPTVLKNICCSLNFP